ncbi:MAG: hypothetical protein K0V04_14365 [Deltaproteobacteria bacterium]|nr:hypothetical protein [Deltaproteobacteria bacterium]
MTTLPQRELFDVGGQAVYEPPAARRCPTSVAAADRIRVPAKTYLGRVLEALRDGPKTDDQLCEYTGLRDNSVRPRRIDLVRRGLVENSGAVRLTRSGREAIVWRLRPTEEETGCRSS